MYQYLKEFLKKAKLIIPKQQSGQAEDQSQGSLKAQILRVSVLTLIAIAAVGGGIAVAGNTVTVSNSVNGQELPIYCVETEKKQVALTFDAAWGNEDLRIILDILKKHNIHATFFMTGGWVKTYQEDVKAILAAGHDLGNHGENHKHMTQLSDEQRQEEIMKVHHEIKELTGYEMFLFRPPYGDYDNHVIKSAAKCGYLTIQWDVDSSELILGGKYTPTINPKKNKGNT